DFHAKRSSTYVWRRAGPSQVVPASSVTRQRAVKVVFGTTWPSVRSTSYSRVEEPAAVDAGWGTTAGPIDPVVVTRISTRCGVPLIVTGCLNAIDIPNFEVALGSPKVTASAARATETAPDR